MKEEDNFFEELINEIINNNISSKTKLNNLKTSLAKKHKIKRIVKNQDIIAYSSDKQRDKIVKLLNVKPVRDISGVTVVALFAKPHKCPHGKCIYCPGGIDSDFGNTPQSYTGAEPAALRAIRNDYDPYLQIFNRLEHYVVNGKIPDKLELIFMGGTFPSLDKNYRDEFVYYVYKAINDFGNEFIYFDENNNKKINSEKFNDFFETKSDLNSVQREVNIKKKVLNLKNKISLNIGIDIDGVLSEFVEGFLNFYNNKLGLNHTVEELTEHRNLKKIIDSSKNMSDLFDEFAKVGGTANLKVVKDSVKILNKISKIHKLYLITSRPNKLKEITLKWLDKNFGNIFEDVIFSQNGHIETKASLTKAEICKEKNIDIFIEDEVLYSREIAKLGTQVLLFNRPWNQNFENNLVSRVISWKEIENKIDNFEKNFKIQMLKCETSIIRPIGLTIETKPDWALKEHLDECLEYGTTRLEIGVQSLDDQVLKKVGRGHGIKEVVRSFQEAKDMCFKINAHMMVNLPYSTLENDLVSLKNLYLDESFKPDMLKIYPCLVTKGTKLYQMWKEGNYEAIGTQGIAKVLAEAFEYFPRWTRVMRIQRDIPTPNIVAGVKKSNLRQYVDKNLKEKGVVSKDIREREIGFRLMKKQELGTFDLNVEEYVASGGKEFFIDVVDENDTMVGFCRLRLPTKFDLRDEISEDTALIRELHVYGSTLSVGEKGEGQQHKGWGKKLIKKAEEIAKKNGYNKIVVISGIGVKEYYKKLEFEKEGVYMSKNL